MVLVALLALFLLAGSAVAVRAQAGEVHFDPQSPAEKEYALPLQQARNEALGTEGAEGNVRPEAAPLFGVGIGDNAAHGEPGAARPSRSGPNHSGHPSGGGAKPASSGDRAENQGTAAVLAHRFRVPEDSYPVGRGLLILAGLLLAGLAVGIGLRARGRRIST
ncbi:MAG: hypothetical protein JSS68_02620 [Actinobacteria bacterium]|nr:hypothetical protein [Actinomycetota bacterium]MBS1884370.1 hypothetical protein [Actinomycetota bacterium]